MGGQKMINRSVQISTVFGTRDCDWLLLAADSLARLRRLMGDEVRFTATINEFTQVFKVSAEADADAGQDDGVLAEMITKLQQSGDVYAKTRYVSVCEQCGQPEAGQHCSQCGGGMINAERVCYYFRIPRHVHAITDLLRKDFVLPSFQRNDLLNSFSNRSYEDMVLAVAVSRGKRRLIPVNWFKLLVHNFARCNYLGDEAAFRKHWTETYIFTSRDLPDYIYYWCGVISALKLSPPGAIVCHNCLQILDRKGQDVSPMLLAKNYGYEGLRYFMLGVKLAPGENSYSEDQVIQKINLDLANELGNLVSRVISLVSKFGDGMISAPEILTRQTGDLDLRETALDLPKTVEKYIESQELFLAVKAVKNLIGKTNWFIETTVPWQLADSGVKQDRLNTILYNLCEALRFMAITLKPLLPEAAQNVLLQLGIGNNSNLTSWSSLQQWGLIPVGTRIVEQPPLFPRIVPGYGGIGPEPDLIAREDLARVNMVVARIVSAEPVPDYEGLFQLILYDGRQRCRVLAPVAHSYTPAHLSGKKVILVANLRPTEIEGLHSEGEVLVTESETGNLVLVFCSDEVPEGSKILCLN